MKKIYLFILLSSIFSCSSDDDNIEQSLKLNSIVGHFSLETQQDVNDFGKLNYTSIDGSLVIGNCCSLSNITTLEPLNNIEGIFGFLIIQNNPQLTSLNGLEDLQYMCDSEPTSISIDNNETLTDISAINNINYCEMMSLSLADNNKLTNINAFSEVKNLSEIILQNNKNLIDLSPFNNLEKIGFLTLIGGSFSEISFNNLNTCDKLHITSCNNLTNVNSLSNLTSLRIIEVGTNDVFQQLTYNPILSNQSLSSLDGLSNITDLEAIGISGGSNNLRSLPNFYGNISSIAIHNTALENLDGFSEGSHEDPTSLYIYNNHNLENVDGLLNYTVLGSVYLVNNTNLNNIDGFDNVSKIDNGSILIDGNSIEQTNSVFESLTTIDFYEINISNNSGFEYFSGFNLLDTEYLSVYFRNNSNLENVNAFNMLKTIVNLDFYNNPNLVSINGFNNVAEGNLRIGSTDNLNPHQPIEIINVFKSNATLNSLGIFNTNITNLDSFQNFNLNDIIQIYNNGVLKDFCGISNQVSNSTTSTLTYDARNNAFNPSRFDLSNGNCRN
jgi:hypothetical protein